VPNLSRRDVLRLGAASALGLSLPQLLAADATRSGTKSTADHCILVFLNGGPSHHDMWDMKPDAPAEIRGEFKPIPTSLAGVQFCEHLPKLGRWMHEATLIRSMSHGVNNSHAAAVMCGMTGHDRGEAGGGGAKPDDHPSIGSAVAHLRPPEKNIVPYVSLPYITAEGAGGPPQPGFFGGWLGKPRDPLFVLKNPNDPDFALPELTMSADVDPVRFDVRKQLASKLGGDTKRLERTVADFDGFRTRAYDLLTAPTTREAFRIDRETPRTREAYGRNIYGQSLLLARRLIEAGTRVTCLSWAPDANATWDTHCQNFAKLKNELLPQLDAAVSSLLSDLKDRGLLERTVVAVMGEFGRTPKINGGAGRDHWNHCYSLMLAGGGIKAGYVHGASDKIGAKPSLNPQTPADVIATVYQCLGLPHDSELRDRLDRPFALVPWGKPIADVIA